ncbi:MAG: ribose-5-phosphate isomerase RpiA [Lachnospiraceae bacterium]|nr:ribose-5-phosphate isomerase RpiA [Lachnospiraceae bacterium]
MNQKKIAGEKAAEYIKDGMIVGLGTGSTARYLVDKVGEMVRNGLRIQAVPTSRATEQQARQLGIPLLDINEVESIDLAIDGVDEIDREFYATKGGGGALFREKVVADLAKEVIWIMDESKLVEHLGDYPLPVEILPYGYRVIVRKLERLGYRPVMRKKDGELFVTDNGNYIVDLHLGAPVDVEEVRRNLHGIVGVLETGQFLKMCARIIVGTDSGAKVIEAR